jgi:hypothetical protein
MLPGVLRVTLFLVTYHMLILKVLIFSLCRHPAQHEIDSTADSAVRFSPAKRCCCCANFQLMCAAINDEGFFIWLSAPNESQFDFKSNSKLVWL